MQARFTALKLISLILGVLATSDGFGKMTESPQTSPRLLHARELLGSGFKSKVVRGSRNESIEVSDFVFETTRQFLPESDRSKSSEVSKAILDASEEFGLDPIFLIAVIQNESSFMMKRVGAVGEIGLMQIRPSTAEWIAKIYEIEYKSAKSLFNPSINIWIGAALMDKLRHQFDSEGSLYVSAYNVGPRKLKQLISKQMNPKAYVQAVMRRYMALYEGYKEKGDVKVLSAKAYSKVLAITN